MRHALALALASALVSAAPRPAHDRRQDSPPSTAAYASSLQASDTSVATEVYAFSSLSASLVSLSDAMASATDLSSQSSVSESSPTASPTSQATSSAAPSDAGVTYGNYSGSAFTASGSAEASSSTPAPSSFSFNGSIVPVTATVDPVKGVSDLLRIIDSKLIMHYGKDPDGPAFSIETGPAQPVRGGKGGTSSSCSMRIRYSLSKLISQQPPSRVQRMRRSTSRIRISWVSRAPPLFGNMIYMLPAPPSTDFGFIGSAKWSMSLGPMRLLSGGWVRQEDETVMPLADGAFCSCICGTGFMFALTVSNGVSAPQRWQALSVSICASSQHPETMLTTRPSPPRARRDPRAPLA